MAFQEWSFKVNYNSNQSSNNELFEAYLIFCRNTSWDVCQPVKEAEDVIAATVNNNTESSPQEQFSFEDNVEQMSHSSCESVDQSRGDELFSSDNGSDKDYRPTNPVVSKYAKNKKKSNAGRKRKTPKGPKEPVENVGLDYPKLIEEVSAACARCNPDKIDPLVMWDQTKFDKVMSRHLFAKHNVKDELMHEQEENKKLLSRRGQVLEKVMIDQSLRIPCRYYPRCPTSFAKALDFRRHEQYHADLKQFDSSFQSFQAKWTKFPCLADGCHEGTC